MKHYFKRLVSLWAAAMMLFNVILPTGAIAADKDTVLPDAIGYLPTNDYNFRSVLGNGLYFGITANKLEQTNDLQTNFAVNSFSLDIPPDHIHSITPDLSGTSPGSFYVGTIEDRMVPNNKGADIFIYTSNEDKIFKHGEGNRTYVIPMSANDIKNNVVDPIIRHGRAVSNDMATKQAHTSIVNGVVDTMAFDDNVTIYIDADGIEWNGDGLTIKKKANQVIVFNYKTSSNVIIRKYKIEVDGQSIDGGSSTETKQTSGNLSKDQIARTIVWNCNKASQVKLGTMLGIVLAPNGNVQIGNSQSDLEQNIDIGSSSAGWIIAGGTVRNESAEWHGIYYDMPDVHNISMNLKKTVNNEDATGSELFKFALETGIITKDDNGDGDTEYSFGFGNEVNKTNHGASIEFSNIAIPANTSGWVVYRIHETEVDSSTPDSNQYKITDRIIYVAVYITKFGNGSNAKYIPGPVQYFNSFDEDLYLAYRQSHDQNSDQSDETASNAGLTDSIQADKAIFNNTKNSYEATGHAELKAEKTGTNLNGKTFTFILTNPELCVRRRRRLRIQDSGICACGCEERGRNEV